MYMSEQARAVLQADGYGAEQESSGTDIAMWAE